MQARIKCLILKKVTYPSYLMGGLSERDYVRNAAAHAGARVLLNEDISKFFPSISAEVIFDISDKNEAAGAADAARARPRVFFG